MGYSQPIDLVDITLPKLQVVVQNHINATLALLPDEHHRAILEQYNALYQSKRGKQSAEQSANLFILNLRKFHTVVAGIPYYHFPAFLRVFIRLLHADKAGKKLAKKMHLVSKIRGFWCISFDEVECKANADTKANHCKRIIKHSDLDKAIDYATSKGILLIAGDDEAQEKRVTDSKWWAGQLKRISSQGREVLWQILGLVSHYISKQGYESQQKKHENSIKMLAENVAVSPDGKEVSLLDIALSAIRGRFSRLLCWTDGMGDYAEKHGHSCAMYTITCPSRMHPNSKKYDGTSPRDAQQYLSELWNQANARFKKHGFYPYGVRVSEPHKDGAPHWHILLFAPMPVLVEIDGILSDHALRIDGFELGADLHRYEFKIIDKQKGGAKPSSYLFKYLMKGLGGDAETYTADDIDKIITEKLTDVKAWARTHGIRQVQIVGGASVGVWNELRRMDGEELADSHLQAMKQVCMDNDFCTYFEMQGGHSVGKQAHYARPCRESVKVVNEKLDTETGEILADISEAVNVYGEVIEEVVGIKTADQEIINRRAKWSINWERPNQTQQEVNTVKDFALLPENLATSCIMSMSNAEQMAYEVAMGWMDEAEHQAFEMFAV